MSINYDQYFQKIIRVVDALVEEQNYGQAINILAAFCTEYKDKLRNRDSRILVFAQERLANLLLQYTNNSREALRCIRGAVKTCRSRSGEHITHQMHISCLKTLCAAHKACRSRADLLKDSQDAMDEAKKLGYWPDFCAFALYRLDEVVVNSLDEFQTARNFINEKVLSIPELDPTQNIFFQLVLTHLTFTWAPREAEEPIKHCTTRLMELTRSHPSHYLRILWVYNSILSLCWMDRAGTWSAKYKLSADSFNPEHFVKTIESYYKEATKIYQSSSPLKFLEWTPQEEIESMLSLFNGMCQRAAGDFTKAIDNFKNSIHHCSIHPPSPNFVFLLNSLVCECQLVQENYDGATETLTSIIDNYGRFHGSNEHRRYRAIIIHSLCAHYAIALQLLVQAKNHCKRLYRLTQKDENLVRIYARLQLALLRLGFGSGGNSDSDQKKSEKEISRYSKEVDDCHCPILKGCAIVADGLLKSMQGQHDMAKRLWRETIKSCDEHLGDSRITAAALALMGNHLYSQQNDTSVNTEQILCSALQAGTKHPSKNTQLCAAWILMKVYEARNDMTKAKQLQAFLDQNGEQWEQVRRKAMTQKEHLEKITGWHNNLNMYQ